MKTLRLAVSSLFLLFLIQGTGWGDIPYQVEFCGVEAPITSLLEETSQLVELQDLIPLTDAALKKRIKDDVPHLLKAMQSQGYYSGKISVAIDNEVLPCIISYHIETGPLYVFVPPSVVAVEGSPTLPSECLRIECLGITEGEIAHPKAIVEAEERLMKQLEYAGHPLAKLVSKEVIADEKSREVRVIFYIDSGPLAILGPTSLSGNKSTLPIFFCRKLAWLEGEQYSPYLIRRTFDSLEASGLFSSISIEHDDTLDDDGYLPMTISVKEAKPLTIAFGVGYATDLGGGVNFEWQHRNMRRVGERLSVVANLWQIKQSGYIKYVKPDFLCPRQDLIWTIEAEHEALAGFRELSYSFSGILEKQLTDTVRFSFGGMFTRLRNTHSNDNGNFNLIKAPFQVHWNGSNSLLDPSHGMTVHFKATPTLNALPPCFGYTTQSLTATTYISFNEEETYVFAGKATFGSILGANRNTIPPSERFYAGSDTLLRGYHYMTVSPLNYKNKPIGGRSMMIYSFEMRMKVYDPFGIVLFYDMGNVYSQWVPQFNHKQLQSTGIGFRYHTPVGPLRLDFAFPLNPRRHLDKTVEVYFSIGQSF